MGHSSRNPGAERRRFSRARLRDRQFLAVFIGEVRQDARTLDFARVGSLERVMPATGRRTAGCLSISVEPRATRLEIIPLPVISRIGRFATVSGSHVLVARRADGTMTLAELGQSG
jgi:hypothetical protein